MEQQIAAVKKHTSAKGGFGTEHPLLISEKESEPGIGTVAGNLTHADKVPGKETFPLPGHPGSYGVKAPAGVSGKKIPMSEFDIKELLAPHGSAAEAAIDAALGKPSSNGPVSTIPVPSAPAGHVDEIK